MRGGPLDDPRRLGDHLTVIGEENRHHPLAAQLLDLAATGRGPLEDARTDSKSMDLDHLGLMAGIQKCLKSGAAGMLVPHRPERSPADVELHDANPIPGSAVSAGCQISQGQMGFWGLHGVRETQLALRWRLARENRIGRRVEAGDGADPHAAGQ